MLVSDPVKLPLAHLSPHGCLYYRDVLGDTFGVCFLGCSWSGGAGWALEEQELEPKARGCELQTLCTTKGQGSSPVRDTQKHGRRWWDQIFPLRLWGDKNPGVPLFGVPPGGTSSGQLLHHDYIILSIWTSETQQWEAWCDCESVRVQLWRGLCPISGGGTVTLRLAPGWLDRGVSLINEHKNICTNIFVAPSSDTCQERAPS